MVCVLMCEKKQIDVPNTGPEGLQANSGPVSITMDVFSVLTHTEVRYLSSRGSPVGTSLPKPPATGTPMDVPVPRNVMRISVIDR
jgi:hypothetical protein